MQRDKGAREEVGRWKEKREKGSSRERHQAVMVTGTSSSHSQMLPARPDSQGTEGRDTPPVQRLENHGSSPGNLRPKALEARAQGLSEGNRRRWVSQERERERQRERESDRDIITT